MKRLLTFAVAALLLGASGARADGDPASDVLLAQDVYYPYAPPVSKPLAEQLDALMKRVRADHYPMKVALIESEADLGAYPDLFQDPPKYAKLLAREISFNARPHLLVVMPDGFAGDNLGDRVDEALAPVHIDTRAQSDGLATAAIGAVARIATANGHPVPIPKGVASEPTRKKQSASRRTPSVLVYGGPALLAAFAVGFLLYTQRDRQDREVDPL